MMGGNPSQQKQNIFAQPGQGNPTGNNDITSGQQVKTSSEGDVGNSAGTGNNIPSAAAAPTVADSGSSNTKTAQAAYKANAGKVKAPNTLNNISSNINKAQTGLQQQAADYASKQAASHNYNLDRSVADKAVKNQDTQAKTDVTGLLNRATADQVDTFSPTDVGVADVDLLNSNAGIKQLVSRGRKPTYTPNMAAFDSMLLQGDPNFQRQVSDLKSQAATLNKSVADTTEKSQADAAAAAQANLKSSQDDIRNYLLGYQGDIVGQEKAAADAANAALPGQIEALKAKAQNDLLNQQKLKAQNTLDSIFGAGRASSQLNSIQADPSQYIDWLQGYDPSQFVSQDQAQQYNTINSLLGLGGASQSAAGALPELYSSRGNDLYNTLIDQATAARNKQDATNKSSIQKILDQAGSAAASDNARRLGLTNTYSKDLQNYANQLIKSNQLAGYTPEMQTLINQTVQNFGNSNPAQKVGAGNLNPNLQALDFLSQSQADQLNSLAKDTGLSSVYGLGQYASGGPQAIFDQKALKNSLLDAISSYQKNQAESAAYLKAHPEMTYKNPTIAPAGKLIIPNGSETKAPNNIKTPTKPKKKIQMQNDDINITGPYQF